MHRVAEADVMAVLLVQAGVPERDILREDGSRTTMENFVNAAALLGGAKRKRVLVVTGEDLHIGKLSLDGGELHVDGRIDSVAYEEGGREQGGFLRRLFG